MDLLLLLFDNLIFLYIGFLFPFWLNLLLFLLILDLLGLCFLVERGAGVDHVEDISDFPTFLEYFGDEEDATGSHDLVLEFVGFGLSEH